jgi:hypothetical protein
MKKLVAGAWLGFRIALCKVFLLSRMGVPTAVILCLPYGCALSAAEDNLSLSSQILTSKGTISKEPHLRVSFALGPLLEVEVLNLEHG